MGHWFGGRCYIAEWAVRGTSYVSGKFYPYPDVDGFFSFTPIFPVAPSRTRLRLHCIHGLHWAPVMVGS